MQRVFQLDTLLNFYILKSCLLQEEVFANLTINFALRSIEIFEHYIHYKIHTYTYKQGSKMCASLTIQCNIVMNSGME